MPKEARTKLDSKGVKCIFIGYCQETKGYILFNPINQYVIINRDVIFDKSKNFNIVTMVSKLDSVSSHVLFLLMLMITNFLWKLWSVKIHNIGKRTWIMSSNLYRTIRLGYLLLIHLVTDQWVANGSSRSNIMPMALWQGTRFIWWDLHKLKLLIIMKPLSPLHKWNQFELCLQL